MGISRFYRWLSERYPLINEVVDVDNVPEFDHFYLDMNGIIHNCSHGNTGRAKQASEEHMWLDVFKYVSGLVYRIRPKRLIYLAVDGVAPRAKMNQQRSRRFRAAHDAKEAQERNSVMDAQLGSTADPSSSGRSFDSNCITPGTEFMERLVHHLEFFVAKKLAEDPLWFGLEVVISGPDVPGEGEHKIMDYIRCIKSQPNYDSNTRHCLYGLDADLIMLSLASHEPYFALLREEIDFSFGASSKQLKEQRSMIRPDKFQLLHVNILREYLFADFFVLLHKTAAFSMDGVTDRETTSPTHNESDKPSQFLHRSLFERAIDDFVFFCFLVGNDFLPHLPFAEIGEGGLNRFIECYKRVVVQVVLAECILDAKNFSIQSVNHLFLVNLSGQINFPTLFKFLAFYAPRETDAVDELIANGNWKIGTSRMCNVASSVKSPEKSSWQTAASKKPTSMRLPPPKSVPEAIDQFYQVKLGFAPSPFGAQSAATVNGQPLAVTQRTHFIYSYLEGLQWVFYYYYKGPPSWDWYFPYHYAPFASDVVAFLKDHYSEGRGLKPIEFALGRPFLPFQQLMAVLPPVSGKKFLPNALYQLMVSPSSPIQSYYPEDFVIDMDGVRVPWGGTALIPFVDEKKLLEVTNELFAKTGVLLESEQKRNSHGDAKFFRKAISESDGLFSCVLTSVVSTLPGLVKDVPKCKIGVATFTHPQITQPIFPHWILPGFDQNAHPDFPSLTRMKEQLKFEISFTVGSGIKVFNSVSRKESVMVVLAMEGSGRDDLASILKSSVACNYPFFSKTQKISSATSLSGKVRVKGKTVQSEQYPATKHQDDMDWVLGKLEETGILVDLPGDMYAEPLLELEDGFKYLLALSVRKQPREVLVQPVVDLSASVEPSIEHSIPRYPLPVYKALEQGIHQIVLLSRSVKFVQWRNVSEISIMMNVASPLVVWSEALVWIVLGEVWIRIGKTQEEVGMNLWNYSASGEPLCVPNYSMYDENSNKKGRHWSRWDAPERSAWRFSSLAITALKEYVLRLPELVLEIREASVGLPCNVPVGSNSSLTVSGKRLMERFKRPPVEEYWVSDFLIAQITKFINKSEWRNLNLCHYKYSSMSYRFVALIGEYVEKALRKVDSDLPEFSPKPVADEIYKVNNVPAVSGGGHPRIGSRVVYTKPHGLVAAGSWGTVVGVYGKGSSDKNACVDIVLDESSLNATSLNGACPDSKGLRLLLSEKDYVLWDSESVPWSKEDSSKLLALSNKVLADIVVQFNKSSGAMSANKPAAISAQPAVPPGGIKISVSELFGKKEDMSTSVAPPARRRPQAPVIGKSTM